ncbi:MAG: DNA topoisomerase 3 [Bryobacteraceae bacterium]|nr:DNA topoisomerase 3 [Bryobacteraceae bacterium]
MATQTTVAVVAEKPSVARDIARVLGASNRGDGYLHGDGYVVTWAIGHLVALAQPSEIRPEWKSWRRDQLPMLPQQWPLVVSEQTKDQFEVVRKILTSPKIASVVCATDAGREGELIFRYIYEAAGCDKPVQRLWISSLTPEAIRAGFDKLKDASEYDALADAARGRSRADWLVGMNLSRAYTLACNEEFSVGRVQTPTLAMLVERELTIRNFVSEDFRNVVGTFSPSKNQEYTGMWFRPGVDPMDAAVKLESDGKEAEQIVKRCKSGAAVIESIEAQQKRMSPPFLYDLTELQRHANRLYGLSAVRTLEVAQSLYEKYKLISYPRTDSRHLSADIAKTLPKIVRAIGPRYADLLAPGTGERPLSKRYIDDTKVSDHHAIIPTGVAAEKAGLDDDERRLYDLICRRLLSAWHDDYIWNVTTVITLVTSPEAQDRFHSSGTAIVQLGWKVLDIGGGKKEKKKKAPASDDGEGGSDDDDQTLPPELARGQAQTVVDIESILKKTRPPKRMTDATLLTAMETAGKTLDDKELSDAMKESGLGTPATRAQIIEVLLKRGFIERRGKSIEATDKGIRLIEVVHPHVKSPSMTGQWEAYLRRIHRKEAQLDPFMTGIEDYVREVVGSVGTRMSTARDEVPGPVPLNPLSGRKQVDRTGALSDVLRDAFGFEAFRPNQEEVCRAVVDGRDALLVMPTGAGKSLCYQLPGVVRGGTTLVICPLIALMEDQVSKLLAQGFAADRIHSGRDRATSREVARRYLDGELDFLYIAPERLRVRGFGELLGKRKPSLVAIDEAHCISQWGHDFRPDYRTIGQYLPLFRPAPVIALTATATRPVQTDIARQLGLDNPRAFIHGFRRDNIAVEVVRIQPGQRFELARQLLAPDERRPAIVYTPTRSNAAELATLLQRDFSAAAYHAGMDAGRRDTVQRDFLGGKLDVIVATIAFGMGVDKADVRTVIHTALPGSMEGYYQEIGRAGRDAKPSRAVLMHSWADRHTHDFFFERDYPETQVLDQIWKRLTPDPQPKEIVKMKAKLAAEIFDIALEKLWIHGGAVVDYAENISKGRDGWEDSYLEQRDYKIGQFEKVLSWCESSACRMQSLVRYFGDMADGLRKCGTCDFCDPSGTVAQTTRPLTNHETEMVETILEELKTTGAVSTGKLHQQLGTRVPLERRNFEDLLRAIARAGLADVVDASFEKDGKRIDFRKINISPAGREDNVAAEVRVPVEVESKVTRRKGKAAAKKGKKRAAASAASAAAAPEPKPKKKTAATTTAEAALKAWRLQEARRGSVPAFRILSDKVLEAIVERQPRNLTQLLEVPGLGPKLVEKYGAQIFRVLSASDAGSNA